jgi:predicted membrane-bound spermidine synthase
MAAAGIGLARVHVTGRRQRPLALGRTAFLDTLGALARPFSLLRRRGEAVDRSQATAGTYAGLFVITLSTLMYEVLLTRIFSVTMWYHFAFVAISVALFGMTVGALLVHLLPERFPEEEAKDRLSLFALLFGISMVLSFLTQLSIPFNPEWTTLGVYSVGLTYLVTSVPFIFSGVCVCLALTRFSRQVSKLYAADLVGAALGTLLLLWLLNVVDAPSAVVIIAALCCMAAVLFSHDAGRRGTMWLAVGSAALLLGFGVGNAIAHQNGEPFLRLMWVKGEPEESGLYEKWNSFSRIKVTGNPDVPIRPDWGGMSSTLPADVQARQLSLTIDAGAGTVLTHYDGDPKAIEYMKYQVVNLAHYIRHVADVLVVGVGGGGDVLAALAFDQRSVTGVEINEAILHALNNVYGDFTGHLDRDPRVRFVNDEARSYVARSNDRFDIIQTSFIDTWAATAAGAYALSENSLYTVEAWHTFLDHLAPNGVLAVSRWYVPGRPLEAYRLTALAAKVLRERGVDDPRKHIFLASGPTPVVPVGTILVSPQPFSQQDVATLERVARQMQFEVAVAPDRTIDPTFDAILAAKDVDAFASGYSFDISPPTDNRPFFFQMVRLQDVFRSVSIWEDYLRRPTRVLFSLTIAVLTLTFLSIVLPLALTTKKASLRGMLPFFVFFSGIGLGFLLVEVSQLQRLIIFLGHPSYALSVVLFSLLLSSGVGSLATQRLGNPRPRLSTLWPFVPLVALLVAFGFATPLAIDRFESATTPVRIVTAALLLIPVGFLMGMPFPIGMKMASLRPQAPTAFLWGINGAMSVCASVLAVLIAVSWGISTAFWAGCLSYAVAALALAWAVRGHRARGIENGA